MRFINLKKLLKFKMALPILLNIHDTKRKLEIFFGG